MRVSDLVGHSRVSSVSDLLAFVAFGFLDELGYLLL